MIPSNDYDEDIFMGCLPPKIVIGLTGPFCSGCSTIARFFHDPDEVDKEHGNNFLKKLIKRGLVLQASEGLEINWQNVKKTIADKLDEYEQVKSEIKDNNQPKILDMKEIFKDLGRILERRESLKTLPFLKPYYPKGKPHLFRTLIMSDIIVFRALVEISKGRSSKDKCFNKLAKKANKNIQEKFGRQNQIKKMNIETVSDFYDKIFEKNPSKRLIRGFVIIHNEVRKLRRDFVKEKKGEDVEILQEFGNNIRKYGNPLGQEDENSSKNCVRLAQDMEKVINMIYKAEEAAFFVIDCLRNPNEVIYFRHRFPNFYLVSIFANYKNRFQRRLKDLMVRDAIGTNQKYVEQEFEERDKLDSGNQNKTEREKIYKQDVTKCVQLSDYTINNIEDRSDIERFLLDKLLRLVALILSPGSTKPKKEEVYMNMAYAMSVKSNCICRQVGAVIAGKDGYVVGAGWNDVAYGEISCGLREASDMGQKIHEPLFKKVEEQIKKYKAQDCFCFKDIMAKNEMAKKIDNILDTKSSNEKVKHLKKEHKNDIHDLVEKAGFHQPEYCLALHAEENAIIQGSRIGGPGVIGGTIYTTAQPCTLCAKKIKQSGINRVVYTDPYPKSESDIFMNGVDLAQFEGVKPRAYIKLFMPNHDQKEWQNLEVDNAIPGFDFNKETYLFELG
jgi:deoxycytidylate deaminase